MSDLVSITPNADDTFPLSLIDTRRTKSIDKVETVLWQFRVKDSRCSAPREGTVGARYARIW